MSGTQLAKFVEVVLTREDARRQVAARDAAVTCCDSLHVAFGFPSLEMPRDLQAGSSDQDADRHRSAVRCARATYEHEMAARLRGAFWADVTLRLVLGRNPGDVEARNALRVLQGHLWDHWPAPAVSMRLLEYCACPGPVWQAWAHDAQAPASVQHRYAVAQAHAMEVVKHPTSRVSRGRQEDLFDQPRERGAHG